MQKTPKPRSYTGTTNPAESPREVTNKALARRAAAEGIVLLENDGILPLANGASVALYGTGARHTVIGGTGSGMVNCRGSISIDAGLKNAGFTVTTTQWLDAFDADYDAAKSSWIKRLYDMSEPGNFDSLYRAHASNPLISPKAPPVPPQAGTDASTALYVISRISGEGADRKEEKGDYYLTDDELELLTAITDAYEKTIVILNVGGIIDLSFMDTLPVNALVLMSQAGMEGGNALADILTGAINPCGKLTDTWAYQYSDYPYSSEFSHNNGNIIEEYYKEGIFVGYRYFDTFDVTPRYSFGYGLSYTTFNAALQDISVKDRLIHLQISVTNTGSLPGREVIQVYVSCPDGRLVKERKRLTAFAKTKLLSPGETQYLKLNFSPDLLESFHSGKCTFLLEKGTYRVYYGNASCSLKPAASLLLEEDVITACTKSVCPLLDALPELETTHETIIRGKNSDAISQSLRQNSADASPASTQNSVRTDPVLCLGSDAFSQDNRDGAIHHVPQLKLTPADIPVRVIRYSSIDEVPDPDNRADSGSDSVSSPDISAGVTVNASGSVGCLCTSAGVTVNASGSVGCPGNDSGSVDRADSDSGSVGCPGNDSGSVGRADNASGSVSSPDTSAGCGSAVPDRYMQLAEQLTLEEAAALVCGAPSGMGKEIIGSAAVTVPGAAAETTSTLLTSHGIAPIVLADGPAGIRILSRYEVNPADGSIYQLTRYQSLENRLFQTIFPHEGATVYYQYTTAIPVGALLAQTFDEKLLAEVGDMIGGELEEFGITFWLAPGMNIHRNPLCGRNFEYYSEDPLISGKMAAALTRGVQSHRGIGTTIKHYACNNQEENRRGVSSIVSERALREIYLKGFEIAIKESSPLGIMTSYNKVNGLHTANSYDLCTMAARDEWGFSGVIMTDWTTTNKGGGSSAAKCLEAGNDLIMPGNPSDIREIVDAVRGEGKQHLDERYLRRCAANVLRVILCSNAYEI